MRLRLRARRRALLAALTAAVTTLGVLSAPPAAAAPAPLAAAAGQPAPVTDPASVVNPLIGTGSGGQVVGDVDTFPGADAPFGMLQWSPDTSPDRTDGGGYFYGDKNILGFSLTHISGPGCGAYGDVPILPTVGSIGTNPEATTEPFSHSDESASAGYYQVALGSPAVNSQLTVTPRSGIGKFTFPSTTQANFLIKAGDSENGDSAASATITSPDTVTGAVTSGHFCGAGGEQYTLHYVIQFDQPFVSYGTWSPDGTVTPLSTSASGAHSGAFVTFDTTTNQTVRAKVAISFVSLANAEQNLSTEDPGWSFSTIRSQVQSSWNKLLGKIQIYGGTPAEQQTFYTALYHSLLHPNIFSDVNGQYMGYDGKVHTVPPGHASYANFSGWDIYRSQVQLASMLAPGTMSDVVQTMLDDYSQTGMLNKWTLAHGESYVMVGDPADPIIADAYAFGARGFDTSTALSDMVAEATKPNNIRPGLDYLEKLGYLPSDGSYGCCNFYGPVSTTLEYDTADFSIGALAAATGQPKVASQMVTRAQDWENVYNPASGYMQPRKMNGQYVSDFNPSSQTDFVEGNAAQYSLMVPFNLAGLISAEGGDKAFTQRLDTFFTHLNVGPDQPYYWAGNEPNLFDPWEYDYAGAPYKTQATVRRIITSVYGDVPGGEPGNDDLGAMSSWYVWAALGMFPETPGTSDLALASPLFPKAVVHLSGNRQLVIDGNGASAGAPYVQSMTVDGHQSHQAWLPAAQVMDAPAGTTTTVAFTLGTQPNTSWGTAPGDVPPSYGSGEARAIGFLPKSQVTVAPGKSVQVKIGVQDVTGSPQVVQASVSTPSGLTATPSSTTISVPASGTGYATVTLTAAPDATQTFYSLPVHLTSDGAPATSSQPAAGPQALRGLDLTVLVAKPGSLLTFFDNAGISSDSNQSAANFDGDGYSYSEQALAAAGLTEGGTVDVPGGPTMTWPSSPPGYPDNVVAAGQTIPVEAAPGDRQIGFLGAATNGPSQGELTLHYTDGSSTNLELSLSDWTLNAGSSTPSFGNQDVATLPYRNCACGTSQTVKTHVFFTALPLDPNKTLASVTLPTGADQGSLHVFSIATSATAPAPPVIDSLSPATASAGQQVTIHGSGFGASQGSGYVAFSDGGTNWGRRGNTATFQVDSWSDDSITFTVPTPSGSGGMFHVDPGTVATVTVFPSAGGTTDTAALEITPTANPADYYDNTGVSPDTNQSCANFDGDGYSYSAEALAAQGITPGSTVKADGVTFTWPSAGSCSPDNILASGETMLVNGTSGAKTLGFLGSSANGSSSGTVTIGYTDGTTSTATLSFNDWASSPGNGDVAAATMPYRNSDGGSSQQITMYVFATTVPVDPAKTVSSVTFPDVSNGIGQGTTSMHIFSLAEG
jgi:predicted alpha-1,2-mannosidase